MNICLLYWLFGNRPVWWCGYRTPQTGRTYDDRRICSNRNPEAQPFCFVDLLRAARTRWSVQWLNTIPSTIGPTHRPPRSGWEPP